MNHFKDKSLQEVFVSLVKGLTAAELKKFIDDYARSNEPFLHLFIIQFIESSAVPPGKKYRYLLDSMVQYAGMNLEYDGPEAVKQLTQNAAMMTEAKDFLTAFHVASAIIANKYINL